MGQAVRAAIKYTFEHPQQALLMRTESYQTERRVDMNERWEIMQEHISDDAQNALDIGCNQGGITRRAANQGGSSP